MTRTQNRERQRAAVLVQPLPQRPHADRRTRQRVEADFSRERNGQALARLYRDVVRERRVSTEAAGVSVAAIVTAPLRAMASRVSRKIAYLLERRRAERLREDPAPIVAALAGARHILVVCHGNIIRSPFAARLIDHLADGCPRRLTIASAGLSAEPGRPPHSLAVETAAPLARATGIAPVEIPELREVQLGEWDHQYPHKMASRDPLVERIEAEQRWDVIPGAEPAADFTARVRTGIDLRDPKLSITPDRKS